MIITDDVHSLDLVPFPCGLKTMRTWVNGVNPRISVLGYLDYVSSFDVHYFRDISFKVLRPNKSYINCSFCRRLALRT